MRRARGKTCPSCRSDQILSAIILRNPNFLKESGVRCHFPLVVWVLLLMTFAGAWRAGAATTPLQLRSESAGTCIYNGSTTQTIEYNTYGTNVATLPFPG